MWSNLQTILQRRPLYQLCFSSALQKSSTSHEMYVEPLNPSPGKTNRKCMKMLRITEYSCIAMTQSIRKIMACRTVIAHSKPPCVKPFQHHHWNMSAKVTFAFPSFPTDSPRFLAGWWYTYPSEKWWSSSVGMMIIPNIWKNEIHVPSHQPVKDVQRCAKMFKFLMFIFSPCRITWTENHQPNSHYH